jgi:hypothetical protein
MKTMLLNVCLVLVFINSLYQKRVEIFEYSKYMVGLPGEIISGDKFPYHVYANGRLANVQKILIKNKDGELVPIQIPTIDVGQQEVASLATSTTTVTQAVAMTEMPMTTTPLDVVWGTVTYVVDDGSGDGGGGAKAVPAVSTSIQYKVNLSPLMISDTPTIEAIRSGRIDPTPGKIFSHDESIIESSSTSGVNPFAIAAIIEAETNFDNKPRGAGQECRTSPMGAKGYGQFMAATWKRYHRDTSNICDPHENIMTIGKHIRDLNLMLTRKSDRSFDPLALIAMAYNCCGTDGLLSGLMSRGRFSWEKISRDPKLPEETRNYVPRVIGNFDKYLAAYQGEPNVLFVSSEQQRQYALVEIPPGGITAVFMSTAEDHTLSHKHEIKKQNDVRQYYSLNGQCENPGNSQTTYRWICFQNNGTTPAKVTIRGVGPVIPRIV